MIRGKDYWTYFLADEVAPYWPNLLQTLNTVFGNDKAIVVAGWDKEVIGCVFLYVVDCPEVAAYALQPFACAIVIYIDLSLLIASDSLPLAWNEYWGCFIGLVVEVAVYLLKPPFFQVQLPQVLACYYMQAIAQLFDFEWGYICDWLWGPIEVEERDSGAKYCDLVLGVEIEQLGDDDFVSEINSLHALGVADIPDLDLALVIRTHHHRRLPDEGEAGNGWFMAEQLPFQGSVEVDSVDLEEGDAFLEASCQ